MNPPPKISVILPAVNEEAFIERAISSIKDQNYENLEIIVSANGSTDTTTELAAKAGAIVINNPRKAGASKARNDGAKAATGDIYIFLDADSYLGRNVLHAIVKKYKPNSFGTTLGWPDEPHFIYGVFFFVKNVWHQLKLYKGALGGLMFFDKNLFHKIGGYNAGLFVDEIHDISKRARAAGGKYVLVQRVFAYTSLRRFKLLGTFSSLLFWCKARFKYIFKKKMPDDNDYVTF